MGKKKFAAVALDLEHKTHIIHVKAVNSVALPSSSPLEFDVHTSRRPQISKLIVEKASTKISDKYVDFADIFSPNLASKLSEHIRINDHVIELVNSQQPSYGPIYSLGLVELMTLKAYIKTNLINRFIRLSKSPTSTSILFDRKSDNSLRLCINY